MRTIKFRGLRTDSKGWAYGYYFVDLENKKSYIHLLERENTTEGWMVKCYEVIPESVEQFTGLLDKNGVEIYEGDILNGCTFNGVFCYGKVVFYNGRFCAFPIGTFKEGLSDFYYVLQHVEVIGNIHENSSLLK